MGTVEYVAPEQIEGRKIDGRADVYSLGCVLFQMLTGSPPFAAEQEAATLWAHLSDPPPSASERRPGIPPGIDAVIERAMAKSADDRFPTAGELAEAARTSVARAPAPEPPPPPPPPPPAPPPLRPAPMPAAPGAAPGPPTVPPIAPPTPSPGRRKGPPVGLIVGLLAALAAVIVVVAVVIATGGDDPPVDGPPVDGPPVDGPPAGPFPNAAEAELLGHIPTALQSPPCERATAPVSGAVASVECFTDTPQLMDYALFRDAAAMDAAYRERVATSGVTEQTGDCAAGEPAEDSWLDPAGATAGRLLCFTNEAGSPAIAWTHDRLLILAEASRPAGELTALYGFWTGIADHSATAQPQP